MPKDPIILLTNDDGYDAEGLNSMFEEARSLGEVYIVAPDREQSACSMALTLHHPLRVKFVRKRVFAVDGTPADCIYLAVRRLLPAPPDLIISGINRGPNLGQQDISYSGTVAGAVQGTFLQISSLAVSHKPENNGRCHFAYAAGVVSSLCRPLMKTPLPPGITLNINIPAPPVRGLRLCKLGQKRYHPEIVVKKDPRQRDYYWIGTGTPKALGDPDSDVRLHEEGYITITPLQRDLTADAALRTPRMRELLEAAGSSIHPPKP